MGWSGEARHVTVHCEAEWGGQGRPGMSLYIVRLNGVVRGGQACHCTL